MEIFFGTAITKNYLKKSIDYLTSLKNVKSAIPFCITIGFDFNDKGNFPHVKFLNSTKITCKLPGNFTCIQYGDFIESFTGDNLFIFTDADGVVQRDIDVKRFAVYDNRTIGLGHNAFKGDNLGLVYPRLIPLHNKRLLEQQEQVVLTDIPAYNTGFIVGKTKAFEEIRNIFVSLWDKYSEWWKLPAKIQYLICLGIYKLNFNVDLLDYDIHSHGHGRKTRWRITKNHSFNNGTLLYKNEVVCFAHHIN